MERARRLIHRTADAAKAMAPASARRRLVAARLAARRLNSSQRRLPELLVIGAQRSGTSSLYKYLGRHPDVAPSLRKEVEYFSTEYRHGPDWYRAHFPRRGTGYSVAFEASPNYLFFPAAAERAAALVPDARLLVLLRDPADRAFSHYHHMVRLGFEQESFETALELESSRIEGDLERAMADPGYRPRSWLRYSYVDRGRYATQLRRWLDRYPRSRLLVVRSEALYADTAATLTVIQEWLGLDPWLPEEFRNFSYVSGRAAGYGQLAGAVRADIYDALREEVDALEPLLGERFDWSAH